MLCFLSIPSHVRVKIHEHGNCVFLGLVGYNKNCSAEEEASARLSSRVSNMDLRVGETIFKDRYFGHPRR